jgi:hypothetical protein
MEFFNDIGSDPLKPSLFELVAQEQLRDLLQPALKYVLAVGEFPRLHAPHAHSANVGIRSKISAILTTPSKST